MGMLFQDFVELYFEDMSHRLKESTIISKHYMVDKKILPVFGKIPINEITPKDIRKWQNSLTAYRDETGSMGKSHTQEMNFWTKAEFEQFIVAVQDKPASYTAFMTLYYTGMRVGELCINTCRCGSGRPYNYD